MIAPTEADIGRKVAYRPRPEAAPEEGIISTLCKDRAFAFVRFRAPNGELTPCEKLEWVI